MHIDYCKRKNGAKDATVSSAKSSTKSEQANQSNAQATSIVVYYQTGTNNVNIQNNSLPVTGSNKASVESFTPNLSIANGNNNPFTVLNTPDGFVQSISSGQESAGTKEDNKLSEQSIQNKASECFQNENANVGLKESKESSEQSKLNVEGKGVWKDDSKLFENEKNNIILDTLTENLVTKPHLNTPILDLSDDIDFSITKSFTEMINEDCNLDKSMSFVKGRHLDFFASVQGSSLLSNEISLPHSSSLEQSSFYSLDKSGFLQSSFNSCDDVTDEEKYRIVENLLSETEDKFLGSDYDMTDGCTNDHPDSECVINENKKESEKKNCTVSEDKTKVQFYYFHCFHFLAITKLVVKKPTIISFTITASSEVDCAIF